jgi:branched-chain amino acid transport system substrate-binding protein
MAWHARLAHVISGAAIILAAALATGAAPAADEIKIGILSPFTGPTAKFGQMQRNTLTMAQEDVNGAGGIKSLGGAKITFVFGDTRGEADVGVTETERLITKEKVVAVIGAFQSGVGLPASAVAERYQVPWVTFGTVDTITTRGFKYVFRAHGNDTVKARVIAEGLLDLAAKHGPVGSAVIVAENTEWGKSVSQKQKTFLEAKGVKVHFVENYPFKSADLTSMIVKAKATKPELVIADSYLGDALLITRTMAEQEFKPVVYGSGGGGHVQPDFVAGVGGLAEGVISCVLWDAGMGRAVPWIAAENDRHKQRFGVPMTEDAAGYYQAFYVLVDALERTKTISPKALRDAIAATKITDPNNKAMIMPGKQIVFDEGGQNQEAGAVLVQWQKGDLKLVYPTALADPTAKLVWPYPQAK